MSSTDLVTLTAAEVQALAAAEAVIEAGMQTTWRVAQALHEIHKARLYRASHPTFEAYLAERWGISRSQGHRMVRAGVVLAELAEADLVSHACDISGRTLDVLARAPEGQRAQAYTEAVAQAGGEPTAASVREVVERHTAFDDPSALAAFRARGMAPQGEHLEAEPETVIVDRTGNPIGRMASDEETTDDWHTPNEVLDLARKVFGGRIDTDPASCLAAQDNVRASRWFGPQEDGLKHPWEGRVWLNPPFSAQGAWVDAALERIGGDTEAVLLVGHANTDAKWWHQLKGFPVALSNGRIRYLRPDGTRGGQPPRGTAIFMLGGDVAMCMDFIEAFGGAGWDVRLPSGVTP